MINNMSPREKYSSLKHLILEVPLDRVNKKELIAKTNLFSQGYREYLKQTSTSKLWTTCGRTCGLLWMSRTLQRV